ncbi:polysaccharide pyruvyl transferase family protein [Escherichia coli]|nr:polysaccharide pyruvyl transferase family protein [Escherichia coli]
MNIIIANGAVKNSGDFLIRDSFVSFFNKNATINYQSMLYQDLVNAELENTNIIFCGGPVFEGKFQKALYKSPHKNCRYIFFGAGSYLFNYSEEFTKMRNPLKLEHLAVRDNLTKKVFGLADATVTGCSASYKRSSMKILRTNRKIAISAPQRYDYFPYTSSLIKHLQSQGYRVSVFFNRGWDKSIYTSGLTQMQTAKFVNKLINDGIDIVDASGHDGMASYDGYDMHIGFRLHSHYYFLQNGVPSKLLVEDSRGLGANQLFDEEIIWPYKFDINISKANAFNSKISASIFRALDSINIRHKLNKKDIICIDNFLNKPKDFSEKQEELESVGCNFIGKILNGL